MRSALVLEPLRVGLDVDLFEENLGHELREMIHGLITPMGASEIPEIGAPVRTWNDSPWPARPGW